MKATAIQRYIHISSQKAKLVVDLIRNKPVTESLIILDNTDKKAAPIVKKLLIQAIANATNNHAMDGSKLYIYKIVANQAPTLKRTNPRARGSADLLKKRYSHIEITLSDDPEEMKKDLKKIKDLKTKRAQANKGYSAKQRKENLSKTSKDSKAKKPVVKKDKVSKTTKSKTIKNSKIENKGSK
ncbi:MAG: 50S ribosomal protein L22 [Mycoplasmoidaceae bacterium]